MTTLQYVEFASVVFNVAYVVLAARKSIWCWPMGVLGSALGIWIFIQVQLYAEAVLFSYYVFMGLYGWWEWSRPAARLSSASGREESIKVQLWSSRKHILLCATGYALSFGVYLVLVRYTDAAMPMLDAFTTVFAFIATWLVAKRVLENWIYWIAIDCLSVYLYLARGLEQYALLSLFLTAMAVYGYLQWRKETRYQAAV